MSYLDNPGSVLDLIREGEVHRDLYTSKDIFGLEMQHLFRNTWGYVGHASQIPNRGDYFTTTVADQPIVMIRHQDDTIKVLYNRCPHRGAELVTGTHGCAGKSLRCPYHAWTFNTDGSLRRIPEHEGYQNTGFENSRAAKGMTPVAATHVYKDWVFCRLAENGEGFHEFFGDSLSTIDNFVDRSPAGKLEVVGAPLRYINRCNWKMLAENQTDTFHPMTVHASSAMTAKNIWEEIKDEYEGPTPMVVEAIVPFTMPYKFYDGMGIRVWANGHGHTGVHNSIHSDYTDADEYFTAMKDAYGQERAEKILGEVRHNTVYFPNLMVKGPIQKLRIFKPIAVDETLIESWIFRLVGAPDYLLERTAMYNRLINAPTSMVGHDDTEMYERAQQGLRAEYNEWLNIQRMMLKNECTQPEEIHSGNSEIQFRNQFQAWLKYMGTVLGSEKITADHLATGTNG